MKIQMQKNLIWKIVFPVATVLFVGFIFYNSLQNGTESGDRSGGALAFFQNMFRTVGLSFPFSEHFLRKAAHFLEFCGLGILLTLTMRSYTRAWPPRILTPLFFGLLVPVTDEFIQKFVPERSSEVSDVLLDFSGAVTGIAITTLILFLIDRHRKNRAPESVWRG